FLGECRDQSCELAGCLVDSHVTGMYGGSGKTVAWDQLANEYPQRHWPPLILAGGLAAKNVAQAVAVVRPWDVDVASGVESAPGVKDFDLVCQFVANARNAEHSARNE